MSLSCDVLLDDIHKVHFCMVPKLGFISINDMEDFGECWLRVTVEDGWKSNPIYNFTTLFTPAKQTDITRLHCSARSIIDVIIKSIRDQDRMNPAKSVMKFIVNINLSPEVTSSKLMALRNSIQNLLRDKIPKITPINLLL